MTGRFVAAVSMSAVNKLSWIGFILHDMLSRLDDITMNRSEPSTGEADLSVIARRAWLALLAQAPRHILQAHADNLTTKGFDTLRAAEVGLTMVRARISNQGDRFNLGEATVTRCVVRHRDGSGSVTVGVGYVLGRDPERAGWVARIDALLQQREHHAHLMSTLVAPLREAVQQRHADEARATAASRVEFFTLQTEVTG